MSYNGWSNRETWLVNVWFNPESREDVEHAREILEDEYSDMPNGVLKDMIDLNVIDWDELAEHFEEEDEEDEETFFLGDIPSGIHQGEKE